MGATKNGIDSRYLDLTVWIQIPVILISCVTLDKILNLSAP